MVKPIEKLFSLIGLGYCGFRIVAVNLTLLISDSANLKHLGF